MSWGVADCRAKQNAVSSVRWRTETALNLPPANPCAASGPDHVLKEGPSGPAGEIIDSKSDHRQLARIAIEGALCRYPRLRRGGAKLDLVVGNFVNREWPNEALDSLGL